jgi:hypothetical protein
MRSFSSGWQSYKSASINNINSFYERIDNGYECYNKPLFSYTPGSIYTKLLQWLGFAGVLIAILVQLYRLYTIGQEFTVTLAKET